MVVSCVVFFVVVWWCSCGGVFVVVFFAAVFLWWCSESSAEVMAVLKDCHPRLPKVLLKLWLCLKIVIKDCPKFC